jgi:hypothetical protein
MVARFQIEIEHEEQDLLQAVRKVGFVLRGKVVPPQPVEVAVERSKIAAVLVSLERLRNQREGFGTCGLETGKDLEPVVDTPRREQRIGERLVRHHVSGVARKHLLEDADRKIGTSLLLQYDADVEIRGKQIRRERQRALVRAERFIALVQRLQGDAMVVMRIAVGGRELKRPDERISRRGGIVPRKFTQSERAPQDDLTLTHREPLAAKQRRAVGIATLAAEIGKRCARFRIRRRSFDCSGQAQLRRVDSAALSQQHAGQVKRGSEGGLLGKHVVVSGPCGLLRIAGLMGRDRLAP